MSDKEGRVAFSYLVDYCGVLRDEALKFTIVLLSYAHALGQAAIRAENIVFEPKQPRL